LGLVGEVVTTASSLIGISTVGDAVSMYRATEVPTGVSVTEVMAGVATVKLPFVSV
jgi:hypothetical protein